MDLREERGTDLREERGTDLQAGYGMDLQVGKRIAYGQVTGQICRRLWKGFMVKFMVKTTDRSAIEFAIRTIRKIFVFI